MKFYQRNDNNSDFESSSEHSAHITENYGECKIVDIISFRQNDDKNDSQSTLFCTAVLSKPFSSLTSLSMNYLKNYCIEQISDEKKGSITKHLQQLENLSYDPNKSKSLNQNNDIDFDSTSHSQNEYILNKEMSPLKHISDNNKMLTETEESEIGALQSESEIWDIVNSVLKEIYKRNEKTFSDSNTLEQTEYETFESQYTSTLMESCLTNFINKFIKLDKNVRKTLKKIITNILITYFTQSDDLIVESITKTIVNNAKLLQGNQSHHQNNKSYINTLFNDNHKTNPEMGFIHKLLFEMVIQTYEILENVDEIWTNTLVNSSDTKNLSSFSGPKNPMNLKNKDEHPPYTLIPKEDDDSCHFPIIYLKSKNSTIRDDTWKSSSLMSNAFSNRSHKISSEKNDSLIRKSNLTQKKHYKKITASELLQDTDCKIKKLPRIKHISPKVKSAKINTKVLSKCSEKHFAK
ncbi:uncharacterized protein LOC111632853 [Centruroides sculpturatus]|uniref:uncharacterized protein LOC111632853 n=1 Tax=Centruroides sculpturatus TaxID=218467 RepID=UPI000C6CDFC3|nr:uncharacterized protein LOC111632853 [Centruroides sculpturatus]